MTELENLSAQLEIAVKMQENAERLYHKSSERIEEIKMQMLEVNEKNKPKAAKVKELFAAGAQRQPLFMPFSHNWQCSRLITG